MFRSRIDVHGTSAASDMDVLPAMDNLRRVCAKLSSVVTLSLSSIINSQIVVHSVIPSSEIPHVFFADKCVRDCAKESHVVIF